MKQFKSVDNYISSFPKDKPIPLDLINRITQFRANQIKGGELT